MKINKELLLGLIGNYKKSERFVIVHNEISDTSRWSIHYDCVLHDKETNIFWDASYSRGSTEQQYQPPFDEEEDEDGNIELPIELEAYQETVTKYREKTDTCNPSQPKTVSHP